MITLKTRSELAYAYGYWCTPTFKRHVKKTGIILPRYGLLDADIQLIIYAKMGIPKGFSIEEQAIIATLLESHCPKPYLPLPYYRKLNMFDFVQFLYLQRQAAIPNFVSYSCSKIFI